MVLTKLVVTMVVGAMVMVVMMAGHVRGGADYPTRTALLTDLFKNYDKLTLPVVAQEPILVNVSGFVVRRLHMDEKSNQVHLHGWITFNWIDARLKWDPSDYGDLQKLSVPSSKMWLPDLTVYNSGDAASTTMDSNDVRTILYPTGNVLRVPPYDMVFDCAADLTYWPHDTHHCKLKIGSWVHDGYTIDFHLDENLKVTREPEPEGEVKLDIMPWRIDDQSSVRRETEYYPCCEEPYVSVNARLVLVRDAPAYTWIIKVPAVCFSLLTLVIFLLPPDAGEKITFGGVCLLLHLIFLVFVHDTVRNAPTHTPLIVKLVVVELVLVALSVVVAAVVVRLTKMPNTSKPSASLTGLARYLSPVLFLSAYADEASEREAGTPKADEVELADRGSSDKAEKQRVASAQWVLVGAFLDRLALLSCFIVILVVLARFSHVI